MAEKLSIPGSSFDELVKVVRGYANAGKGAGLDELAKLTGINKTIISSNNKFLNEIGLISGGNKKSATELCQKLSRAIDHNQEEDITRYWKEAIEYNNDLAQLITTVKIKGGMTEEDFSKHILYVSGQKNNPRNRAGVNSVVDILKKSGLLIEDNGNIKVGSTNNIKESVPETNTSTTNLEDKTKKISINKNENAQTSTSKEKGLTHQVSKDFKNGVTININIQLTVPETTDEKVYDKFFQAMKKHLLS